MKPVCIGDSMLFLGDCLKVMAALPECFRVNAVVTSPPYGEQRQYGMKSADWQQTVPIALSRIADDDAQVLVNLGLIHRDGRVIRYWDALIDEMEQHEWRLFGWYVWDQLSGMAGDWNGRLAPSFEFIFHFNKIAKNVNKTKATKGGTIHGSGLRAANGTATKEKTHDGFPVQPFKIPDSVIRTARETQGGVLEAGHPARFPERFARELVAPFTNDGETVCDPFMGSGTTGVACAKLGRKFIGIEIHEPYFDIACRRIEAAYKQPDMFIAPPAKPVQEKMDV